MNKEKIVAGYCRAASANEAQIAAQKRELKQFAQERGLRIKRFYVDNGVSGNTLNRPTFERLLRDCRREKIGTVLVTNVDRLSRDKRLAADALWAFGFYGVRTLFVHDEGLETFWCICRAISKTSV